MGMIRKAFFISFLARKHWQPCERLKEGQTCFENIKLGKFIGNSKRNLWSWTGNSGGQKSNKKPLWGKHGYFLESHITNLVYQHYITDAVPWLAMPATIRCVLEVCPKYVCVFTFLMSFQSLEYLTGFVALFWTIVLANLY